MKETKDLILVLVIIFLGVGAFIGLHPNVMIGVLAALVIAEIFFNNKSKGIKEEVEEDDKKD